MRSIDLAPTAAFLLGVPAPQHSQGVVRRDLLDDGRDFTPINIIGLNDFHGQLEPGTTTYDTITNVPAGGAAQLATLFDEETRAAARATRCCCPAATTSAPRRRAPRCSRTCRRSTS